MLKVDKMFKPNNFPLYVVTRKSRVCGCPTTCQIPDVLISCQETDVDDKCDFFQWQMHGKTKVKKSMKKKKRRAS